MRSPRTIPVVQATPQADKLNWFRFGRLGGHVILTTDTGEWHALAPDTFDRLLAGGLTEEDPCYEVLADKGFLRAGLDLDLHASQLRKSRQFLLSGATEHRVHLSTAAGLLSMETAKAIVDHLFTSSASTLTVALVQGPADLNVDLVFFIHELLKTKNQYEKRVRSIQLHSGLEGLSAEQLQQLAKLGIQMWVPFDGDPIVHDAQRHLSGAPAHAAILPQLTVLMGSDLCANVRVGRAASEAAEVMVAGLHAAGVRTFQVQPVLDGPDAIGSKAYGAFFTALLVALDAREDMREVQVDALRSRARQGNIAGHMLLCTPRSTGFNARTYGPDGHIYPSADALALAEGGNPIFLLGNVAGTGAEDLDDHPTIRSLMMASLTDCLPGYDHLWAAPFIGLDPVQAYRRTGDIFAKSTTSVQYKAIQAMLDALFLSLINTGDDTGDDSPPDA
jgi:sulfatase maturation enzyme AslB (radical SAM superfamily)